MTLDCGRHFRLQRQEDHKPDYRYLIVPYRGREEEGVYSCEYFDGPTLQLLDLDRLPTAPMSIASQRDRCREDADRYDTRD